MNSCIQQVDWFCKAWRHGRKTGLVPGHIERVITEARLELFCDDSQVEQVVALIRMHARSGRPESGWVYVSDVSAAYIIHGNEETKK